MLRCPVIVLVLLLVGLSSSLLTRRGVIVSISPTQPTAVIATQGVIELSGADYDGIINVQFQTHLPILSATLAVFSIKGPISASSMTRQSFFRKKVTDFQNCDVEGMRLGRTQYVNIPRADQPLLYYTIFNFDPTSRVSEVPYSILIKSSKADFDCPECLPNHLPAKAECLCPSCPANRIGAACQIVLNQPRLDKQIEVSLSEVVSTFFIITEEDTVDLRITISKDEAELYLQYLDKQQTELASYLNVAISEIDNSVASIVIRAGMEPPLIRLVGHPLNISLTVSKYIPGPAVVKVFYSFPAKTNIALIVVSAFSVAIILGLAFMVCFCYCDCSFPKSEPVAVDAEPYYGQEQGTQRACLEPPPSQLQDFFPTVIHKEIYSQMSAIRSEKVSVQSQIKELECMICLCFMLAEDEVKVMFCRHFFHAKCLTTWLEKQKNCPYCRDEHDLEHLKEKYDRLLKVSHSEVLNGVRLTQAIMAKKNKPDDQDNTETPANYSL